MSAPPSTGLLEKAAREYIKHGYKVLILHGAIDGQCTCRKPSCDNVGKHPRTAHGAKDATKDLPTIQNWIRKWPKSNLGITLAGLVVIDVDPRNGGKETFDALLELHGRPTPTCAQFTGGGGFHLAYHALNGARYARELGDGVDLKHGPAQYIVVAPSIHKSGIAYRWKKGFELWTSSPAEAPHWLAQTQTAPPLPGTKQGHRIDLEDGGIREQVDDALLKINPDCDRDTWVKVGMVLHKTSQGDARGFELWDTWSRGAPNRYPKRGQASTREIYDSFDAERLRGVAFGTLIKLANDAGKPSVADRIKKAQANLAALKVELTDLIAARGVLAQHEPEAKEGAAFACANDLVDDTTRWLWTHFIPFGHLSLLSGATGLGKTNLLLYITALTTRGKAFPFDDEYREYWAHPDRVDYRDYKRSGDVYILTSEAHWSQTLKPILKSCGADLSKVFLMHQVLRKNKDGKLVKTPFDLLRDIQTIADQIRTRKKIPDLIILDPITSFLDRSLDRNTEADVRAVLEHTKTFCEALGIAFVCVLHQNKDTRQTGIGKLLGSGAFAAVPRVVLFVDPSVSPHNDQEGSWEGADYVGLYVEKTNIAPKKTVHTFGLDASSGVMKVSWEKQMSKNEFYRLNASDDEKSGPEAVKGPMIVAAIQLLAVDEKKVYRYDNDVAQDVIAHLDLQRMKVTKVHVVNTLKDNFIQMRVDAMDKAAGFVVTNKRAK